MSSEGSHPLRIAVADDQTAVREGLATLLGLLAGSPGGHCGRRGGGRGTVAREHPDVVLMDLRMPGSTAWRRPRRIRAGHPGRRSSS